MMAHVSACRERIASLCWQREALKQRSAQPGLLLARYLETHDSDNVGKRQLLDLAAKATSRLIPLYDLAYRRWEASLSNSHDHPAAYDRFRIQGRMVLGLGGASVLETGLTLHHTYGTPVIPGSALKGLAAHYCHQVWGTESPEFKIAITELDEKGRKRERPGHHFAAIFGSQQDAGHITFHDAWITPQSLGTALQLDVMTPHHQKYYGAAQDSDEYPPTDFDDPVPLAFLSITGAFLIALENDVPGEEGQRWADLAFKLLTQALQDWGIGGKTNAGYGRLKLESAAAQVVLSEPEKPRHLPGQRVEVTRVEDKKGKKRFEADDGFRGGVVYGDPPEIEIGEMTTLWVAATMKDGYNFRSTDPGPSKTLGVKGTGRGAKRGLR